MGLKKKPLPGAPVRHIRTGVTYVVTTPNGLAKINGEWKEVVVYVRQSDLLQDEIHRATFVRELDAFMDRFEEAD